MEGVSGFTGSQVRIAERINGKNATGRKQQEFQSYRKRSLLVIVRN